MTWVVMCPKWESKNHVSKPHGWSLSREELVRIGNDYFGSAIKCLICGHKFSLQQGVKEAFISDVPSNYFQYNAHEHGETEVAVGQRRIIHFSEPFEDTPKVSLTPHGKPVAAVPGFVTPAKFGIYSCDSGTEGEMRKIGWNADGNRGYGAIPIWRKLISSSKEHQLRKDFRSEVVNLDSAFEVFIDEYLGRVLKNKIRHETIDWILERRSINKKLEIGFIELSGIPLSELEPIAYGRWQEKVRKLRNDVVHRGASVTDEEARQARDAVFDLMTRIYSNTIEHFRIQLEKIRLKRPNIVFGTATIKAGKTSVTVEHGFGVKR